MRRGQLGDVEKYVGDAVVAVVGIPEVHQDDAPRGVDRTGMLWARLGLAIRASTERGVAQGGSCALKARQDHLEPLGILRRTVHSQMPPRTRGDLAADAYANAADAWERKGATALLAQLPRLTP
jgi:hypothetical protein